jgi:hypothetical protein
MKKKSLGIRNAAILDCGVRFFACWRTNKVTPFDTAGIAAGQPRTALKLDIAPSLENGPCRYLGLTTDFKIQPSANWVQLWRYQFPFDSSTTMVAPW